VFVLGKPGIRQDAHLSSGAGGSERHSLLIIAGDT
jgi:hypothetical protein